MAKLTLVDMILVGSKFCPTGYGEMKFKTIRAAKNYLKSNGYAFDKHLTNLVNAEGLLADVFTNRTNANSLSKIYLERD
jgi:hypothetical protein